MALDDELYALSAADLSAARYPKPATDYLEDWAHPDAGWLRRFYPLGSDEVHYDATPAFEKAHGWVIGLGVRPFVGTESRLHTVVELLRQIVHGTETDPELRLAELHRRRDGLSPRKRNVSDWYPDPLRWRRSSAGSRRTRRPMLSPRPNLRS